MNGMVRIGFSLGILLSATLVGALPGQAQESSTCVSKAMEAEDAVTSIFALSRAKNLARQAAENANGGLMVYRADRSMHGAVSDAPCVDNGDGTWTFTVKGGAPGFTTASRETVVTVDGNAWNVKVDYNGPIRP